MDRIGTAIAAFLSVRRELIGKPEVVKQIFLDTATDLGCIPAPSRQKLKL